MLRDIGDFIKSRIGLGSKTESAKSQLVPLTAQMILDNPDRFHPNAVKYARVTSNVAHFLEQQIPGENPSVGSDTSKGFHITVAHGKAPNSIDFVKGGSINFAYTDGENYKEKPLNGSLTFGIKRAYEGSWAQDHPEVSVQLGDLGFSFDYITYPDRSSWQMVTHGGLNLWRNRNDIELNQDEFDAVIAGIAEPLKTFLIGLGKPTLGAASGNTQFAGKNIG